MNLIDKLFHIRIYDINTTNYGDLGEDIEVQFEMLDGPLAGQSMKTILSNEAKQIYLEKEEEEDDN